MDGSGREDEKESIKVGDVEKEKEIERRLRELGLWENKRLLESKVASMLEAHIDEQDALSRTLRNCRRRRRGGESGGGGGKTTVEEIRNIISPHVIRDCYGQKLAYQVNILMGCFTKNIEHEVIDDVVIIRGSTSVDESDPKRLTKELRLELPPSLNMAALRMSYAAGAVKIRVPYVIEVKRPSTDAPPRPYQLKSISPLYSLNMALNSANSSKLGSSGAESLGSDSPNSLTSLLSPVAPATSYSLTDSTDSIQPRLPAATDSPTTTLPSPFPVFEDDTRTAPGNVSGKGKDQGRRCTNESTLEGRVGAAAIIPEEEVHQNGFSFVSGRVNGTTTRVVDFDQGIRLAQEEEECLRSTENFKRNNSLGQRASEKNDRKLTEVEYHNGSVIPGNSNNAANETVESKSSDDRLGNNRRNKASAKMAAIYVDIPDTKNILSVDDDLVGESVISKKSREPMQLNSCEERTSPDHQSNWSSSDHSKPDLRGYGGGSRWQNEETMLVNVLDSETSSAQRDLKREMFADDLDTRKLETSDSEGVQTTRSNTIGRRSLEELDKKLANGGRGNKTENMVSRNRNDTLSDTHLDDKRPSKEKYISKTTLLHNDNDDEKQFAFTHLANGRTIRPQGVQAMQKSLHEKTHFQPVDDAMSAQDRADYEGPVEKNSVRVDTIKIGKVGEKAGLSDIADNDDSRKVTPKHIISDKVSSNDGHKPSLIKQMGGKEEQGKAGSTIVKDDSNKAATSSSKDKMRSPTPKKSIKMLDYLLDSLDETVL